MVIFHISHYLIRTKHNQLFKTGLKKDQVKHDVDKRATIWISQCMMKEQLSGTTTYYLSTRHRKAFLKRNLFRCWAISYAILMIKTSPYFKEADKINHCLPAKKKLFLPFIYYLVSSHATKMYLDSHKAR